MKNMILQGDCIETLKQIPDKSVNCCVTSPPYFGLRDYGHDGQIGLEETPEQFVQKLVEVFREVRRVLKDDGVMFLNLGDSYAGSQRATSYGTYGTKPVNYQESGCLSESLCGVCQQVLAHKSHTCDLLFPMLISSLSLSTRENMGLHSFHPPTSGFYQGVDHTLISILDFARSKDLSDEQVLSFRESMPNEFYQLLLDECLLRGSSSSCLLCARTLGDCVLPCGCSLGDTCDTEKPLGASTHCMLGKSFFDLAYNKQPYIKAQSSLKPKDLIGIPWMVAFALRADGWWLRQDIIWSKPNPMPESVTDRCTKAHEYIFLLSKSAKYYYDAEAIKENAVYGTDIGILRSKKQAICNHPSITKRQNEGIDSTTYGDGKRNKRSVWEVTTKSFKDAHFATFPEDLIVDCIKAGCPEDGIVLDPFGGAGTTAVVARKLNRNYILCELNPEYIGIAQKRIDNTLGLFA